MITTDVFIGKINTGEAQVLTVKAAEQLKGKRIAWFYFGNPSNESQVFQMVVGDVISKFDYYSNQPCDGYTSRAAYWQSYMSEERLLETQRTLMLLEKDGSDPHIYCHQSLYKEPTFTCSDEDREVYYIEL